VNLYFDEGCCLSIERLAWLIHERNKVSEEIAGIIGRPALNRHIGEHVSSMIFGIELEESATAKGIDGYFADGSLKGKSVNVKLYGKKENILDISTAEMADYYLVLSGDDGDLSSSRGKTHPLVITQVFLFNMNKLMPRLKERGVKIGIATSVRKSDWDEAMVYPVQVNRELVLSEEQVRLLRLFGKQDNFSLSGYRFEKVCDIEPVRDESGTVYEYKPYPRYDNKKGLKRHGYGDGPFCSFKIPSEYNGLSGVYAIRVNGEWVYIGKADDLGNRFNQGYGNISPRNCFEGGQQTNCRMNNLILEETKNGSSIELFFYKILRLDFVETELIKTLNPAWNISIPGSSGTKSGYSGKHSKIGEHLSGLSDDSATLTFDEIEEILGSSLPDSASNHRAWWANSGQPHSKAWTDHGWLVDGVSLGEWVRFKRAGK